MGRLPRVLVIEDEASVYHAYRHTFTGRFEAEWARTLEEATAILRHNGIVAVIADLCLTLDDKRDGMRTVAHLRRYYPEFPVVVVSGFLDVSDVIELHGQGVECAEKPVDPFALVELVERVALRPRGWPHAVAQVDAALRWARAHKAEAGVIASALAGAASFLAGLPGAVWDWLRAVGEKLR